MKYGSLKISLNVDFEMMRFVLGSFDHDNDHSKAI